MISAQMSILMLITGVLTGILSGIFGIGGGVVLVPILVFLFQFPQHMANGTSLVALLLPVGFLGVYAYYQAGKITSLHIKYGLIIAAGIFFGTFLGSKLSILLPDSILKKSFAVFMAIVAVKMWFAV